MIDDLVRQGWLWLLPIMALGSIVDIFQAGYLVRRYFKRRRNRLIDKLKAEILLAEHKKKQNENS